MDASLFRNHPVTVNVFTLGLANCPRSRGLRRGPGPCWYLHMRGLYFTLDESGEPVPCLTR
jgi:hypothetical protein